MALLHHVFPALMYSSALQQNPKAMEPTDHGQKKPFNHDPK
jgi:hypothetical protein